MKKDVYVTKISQELGMTKKDVSRVVDAFINELANTISEKNIVVLTNFGTFKKEHVIAKNMFSPVDGSNIKNDYYRIHFSMSNHLSKKISEENEK